MKISWRGFISNNYSWAIVAQNISRQLIKSGHDVDLFSTNGFRHFPKDLENNLVGCSLNEQTDLPLPKEFKLKKNGLDSEYDMQLSYTALLNFPHYLNRGKKNRFGIWCYEFAGQNSLPIGFAKYHNFCDKILAPSKFAKQVFVDSKIPEDKIEVIPHGYNPEDLNCETLKLNTTKKIKILCVIGQPHIRKNLPGLLEAYGKAFTKTDDVCLVLKVVDKEPKHMFEVSFKKIFNKWNNNNRPEVLIFKDFITDLNPLYKACDIVFTMSHSECFWMPGLEGLAHKKIIVAPNWGGQTDFLNTNNSFLIEGKEIPAPPEAHYWAASNYSKYFEPSITDGVDKLRAAVNEVDKTNSSLKNELDKSPTDYTWGSIANQIIGLCI